MHLIPVPGIGQHGMNVYGVRREEEMQEGGAHVAAFEQLNVLPEHAQRSLQQPMLQMLPPALRAASRESEAC